MSDKQKLITRTARLIAMAPAGRSRPADQQRPRQPPDPTAAGSATAAVNSAAMLLLKNRGLIKKAAQAIARPAAGSAITGGRPIWKG